MAYKQQADLRNELTALLSSPGTESVTLAKLAGLLLDFVDSYPVVTTYNMRNAYKAGQVVVMGGRLMRANSDVNSYNPASWDMLDEDTWQPNVFFGAGSVVKIPTATLETENDVPCVSTTDQYGRIFNPQNWHPLVTPSYSAMNARFTTAPTGQPGAAPARPGDPMPWPPNWPQGTIIQWVERAPNLTAHLYLLTAKDGYKEMTIP